ncbi:type III-B CRISPR module RAMP protein Cmr4 [Halorhodospira halochloris]|uniref:type III-B CRISPR module RAMP protein Cmr4 n=1 Tax=Halorhodospira halochloris TaxID=1052 RepID=UPI001EE81D50|nr:type III-B CRISPR module RAMP protein Cmr4 [Halorhodospira halochloris]MCG5531158.1 type III-B CRISPR module RAMP protein Cmr4 [Halorhodospira halochloris]
MQSQLFHLHTLSALHCGTGQSVGVVDLPIARARATQLPIVPGSSLRGVLRQELEGMNRDLAHALFGPRKVSDSADSFAGALAIGDANLLALPVRSLAGIICYATSPFILSRYARDLNAAGIEPLQIPQPGATQGIRQNESQHALVTSSSVNLMEGNQDSATMVLEELDLQGQSNSLTDQWARQIAALIHPHDESAREDFCCRFAILPDNILGFLAETATELRTRISIDENTGTVKKGALWFEEHLPAESLLWGIYALTESLVPGKPKSSEELTESLLEQFKNGEQLLQVGGQAGVGRGLVRLLLKAEVSA